MNQLRGTVQDELDFLRDELRRTQAIAQLGTWRLDVRANVLTWSEETHRIFGVPFGTEMTYEFFLAAVHPDDQAYVDRMWQAALRGESYDIEHRLRVHGEVKWVRERAELEFDEAGGLLGGFGIVQDITARKLAEQALSNSQERLAMFAEATFEGILFSRDGIIEDCNAQAAAMFKLTREQMLGRRISDFQVEEDRQRVMRNIQAGLESHIEHDMVRDDGTLVTVEAHGRPSQQGQGERLTVLRDVTEQRRQSRQLLQLNRTLRAVSHSRHALLWAEQQEDYLRTVCAIVVEDCGHAMVWIGLAEDDEQCSVRPVAHAGFDEGYLRSLNLSWTDNERGRGPTGTAIREARPAFCRDMHNDPTFEPWRAEALNRGYASSAVFPLLDEDGRAFGAISIYSREPDPFSVDEVKLLSDLADDVALGIRTFHLRAAHAQSEQALFAREQLLSTVTGQSPDPIYMLDQAGHFLFANPAAFEILPSANGHPASRLEQLAMSEADRRVLGSGSEERSEESITGPWGSRVYHLIRAPLRDADGDIVGLIGSARDISEHLRSEAQRIKQMESQRDTLVREVHHRIKNHLQGVVGLLRNRQVQQPQLASILQEAIAQIRVIAEVYGLQSRQQQGPVPIDHLLRMIAQGAVGSVLVNLQSHWQDAAPCVVPAEVMPVALISNELITNAIKHLQLRDPDRPVRIDSDGGPGWARVRISAGPASLPAHFDLEQRRGLGTGLELIKALLPPASASLRIYAQGDEVVAELELKAPTIAD